MANPTLNPPPPSSVSIVDKDGRPTPEFYQWLVWAGSQPKPKSFKKAELPKADALGAGTIIYVTDEAGGAVPAFSDGTDWRRVTDRAVVS